MLIYSLKCKYYNFDLNGDQYPFHLQDQLINGARYWKHHLQSVYYDVDIWYSDEKSGWIIGKYPDIFVVMFS